MFNHKTCFKKKKNRKYNFKAKEIILPYFKKHNVFALSGIYNSGDIDSMKCSKANVMIKDSHILTNTVMF